MSVDPHSEPEDFVTRNRPCLDPKAVRAFAVQNYGIDGDLTSLGSERDQNFRIDGAGSGGGSVLKVSSLDERPETIDFQVRFLNHVAEADPEVRVPRVRRTKDGALFTCIDGDNGGQHIVHCLSYLPGNILTGQAISPALLGSLGTALADIDRAARGFHHSAAGYELPWHMHLLPRLKHCLPQVADRGVAAEVATFMENFEAATLPALARLRSQVIHHDANGPNILLDPGNAGRVAGIIDFGDMAHAALACELAVPAADLFDPPDMVWQLCELTSAYDLIVPLEEDDIDALFDLVCARICATILIISARNHGPQADGYMADDLETYQARLQGWQEIGQANLRAALRKACGYAPFVPVQSPSEEPADDTQMLPRRHALLGSSLNLSYSRPVHVEAGSGIWLHGADGTRFLDAYNNVPHVGHAHPHVVRAVARQVAALNTNTRYLYDNILDYSERLTGLLPHALDTCTLVNSGSEANDVAYRMARELTGNAGVIIVDHAYHGITDAVAALSPSGWPDGRTFDHVRTLISPDPYRGPYRSGDDGIAEKYAADADRCIAELQAAGHGVCALMIDSGFTTNGIPDVPAGYLALVAEKVRAAGGLVIGDEVQLGFARSGDNYWGFEGHGIEPDMVTMGKPAGNGYPLGVLVSSHAARDEFGDKTDFFSTFGGNPVGCAAGLAVLDVIEREELQANARDTGAYLLDMLRALTDRHTLAGDARGRGLVIGFEMVHDGHSLEPSPRETRHVVNLLRDNNILVGIDGPHSNVIKIRPPMVFQRTHADRLAETLDRVLAQVAKAG
jgi:4-aminobutyrate aminotransferase-like enzyme/Ser/Thr protein kinase RdoA (MazF antagonist)